MDSESGKFDCHYYYYYVQNKFCRICSVLLTDVSRISFRICSLNVLRCRCMGDGFSRMHFVHRSVVISCAAAVYFILLYDFSH